MKLGLGLYRHQLNAEHYHFARQCGCTHLIVHLVDYFRSSPRGVSRVGAVAGDQTYTPRGTFANIRNNPSLQQVTFAPVNARFFRFTALREVNNNGWTSAAEISILPAGQSSDGR